MDRKPELYWLRDPEIHRQELLDCTPKDSATRDQFVDALVDYLNCTRIQPENVRIMKERTQGNPLKKKIRDKIEKARKDNIELAAGIREWIESQVPIEDVSRVNGTFVSKIVDIELILSQIQDSIEYLSRGVPQDGRRKELELHLVIASLSFWKKYFPEHPLPTEPMQGRLDSQHEPAKPAKICMLVIEFVTGEISTDISRLFKEGVSRIKGIEQNDPTAIILPI